MISATNGGHLRRHLHRVYPRSASLEPTDRPGRHGVFAVLFAATLLGTPTVHADATDDYLAQLLEHGVRTLTYQDKTRAAAIGLEVCQHLRDGSNSVAESAALQRRGAAGDRGEWIVRAAQAHLCPDTTRLGLGP
ncbi:DUF732 domain-containing protein [[Mycobacterium] nativiensis]|uniref:DUF732 domain-containing protein n=1 Tax=[Mycobacterium] nativiensis TaxID=2855503 RepID=UPI001CD41314